MSHMTSIHKTEMTIEIPLCSSQDWNGIFNFYKSDDTFERHVSVVQRPSSVESRINLKLHLNL